MNSSIRLVLAPLLLALATQPRLAAAGSDELPAKVFAPVPNDELQDVLLLAEERPVFVRFHIRVDDEGFRTVWSGFAGRLHRFLDADGNGDLTLQEAQRGNWQQLLTIGLGRRTGGPAANSAPSALDSNPKDGTVSTAELASYLRGSLGFGAFGIQAGPAPDPKSQALFGHLDADHDGTLSAAELAPAATDSCVARLDLDGDELISLAEMKPYENPYADRFRAVSGQLNGREGEELPVVALDPGAVDPRLVRRLIVKYDRGLSGHLPDGRLTAAELGTPPETLRRFDADGDGALDPAELTVLLGQSAPDLEFDVALHKSEGQPGRIDRPGPSRASTLAALRGVPRSADGSLQAELDGLQVEFAVAENLFNNRLAFDRQFSLSDGDRNGYVDKAESMRSGLGQIFPVADRDGDGKLFKQELEAYIERQSDAIASRMMLTVSDRGRALFELLDADGDHRLSVRELRRSFERLSARAGDGDGRIAEHEVLHQYRLGIGRGPAFRVAAANELYDPPDPPGRKPGPPWFEKMDLNRDGDISVREFLGPLDQFRRFDADGDGLIDAGEAAGKESG